MRKTVKDSPTGVATLLASQLGALAVPHGSCRRDHSFDFRASACDEH